MPQNEMKDLIVLSKEEASAYDKMPAVKINESGAMIPGDLKELFYFSRIMAYSGMVPKDCSGQPGVIMAKVQYGATLGLDAMTSIQSIANIGNIPAPFGDVVLGIVRQTGTLEEFFELEVYLTDEDEGTGNETAICIAKRTDIGTHVDLGKLRAEDVTWKKVVEVLKLSMYFVNTFSVDDATVAGLASKTGPWTNHPKRMRKMRARSFTLRDGWPDFLKGMHTKEELDGETIELQPEKNGTFTRAEQGPEDLKSKLDEAPIVLDKPQPAAAKPEPEKEPGPEDEPDGTKAKPEEREPEDVPEGEEPEGVKDEAVDAELDNTKVYPWKPSETVPPPVFKDLEAVVAVENRDIQVLNHPADCDLSEPGWSMIATYFESELLSGKQTIVAASGFPNYRLVRYISNSKKQVVRFQGGADPEKKTDIWPEDGKPEESKNELAPDEGSPAAKFINQAMEWASNNDLVISVFMKTFYRYLAYVAKIRNKNETVEQILAIATAPETVPENWFKNAIEWDKNDVIDLSEGAQESDAHDEIRSSQQYKGYNPLRSDYINRYTEIKKTKIIDLLEENKIDWAPNWSGLKLHKALKEGVAPPEATGDGAAWPNTVEEYRARIADFPAALIEAVQTENTMAVGATRLPPTLDGCKNLLDLLIAEAS